MRRLFQLEDGEDVTPLIRTFAGAQHFRSATVDELELDTFFRRPLRPEDLGFIGFTVPVAADTICNLPSLAAQRILRCNYDLQIAGLPRSGDAQTLTRQAKFYSDQSRVVGAHIAPFLERFAFGFLEEGCPSEDTVTREKLIESLQAAASDSNAFADVMRTRFLQRDFSKAEFRFLLIQKYCLGRTKQIAIARAKASGCFDLLPPTHWPREGFGREESDALARLATAIDVDREPHAFWQFYLPTSLAETNLLSALAARPECSLALVGASFVAEAEWESVVWLARQAGRDLGIAPSIGHAPLDLEQAAGDTSRRFKGGLDALERAFGRCGLEDVYRGMNVAGRLARLARLDLEKQLRWLASIDDYVAIARRVDHHVQAHRPDIDRDTFVEPREMCSTTHVHDDHRLVVVESGNMVFWGCPEMRFRMAPGDMVLVPRGRLHGSSVESDQCTYHQPIIPDDWVRPLVDEVERHRGWPPL